MIVNCSTCGIEIDVNPKGHSAWYCPNCMKKRKAEMQRKYYQKHTEHYRANARDYRTKHKSDPISSDRAEYLKRDSNAARKIRLQLPQICIICGTDSHLQAHRKDKTGEYTLENVVLLCPACHKRVHSGVETID